ncbi:MAG: glycosyltransferase family 4 protein [Fibrobacter sp.]|nr:glycosyltransferase family 4 protein [Fibrobacter sp.]
MKILLINYRYFISGGPERYMFNVKALLEKNGHDVIPFSIKSPKNVQSSYEEYFAEPLGNQDTPYFDRYKKTPNLLLDVITRLFYSFHVKKKLESLIQSQRPDIALILHHYNKLSPSVIDACKRFGLPVLMRLSDFFLVCPGAHFWGPEGVCERCLSEGYLACVKGKCIKGSIIGSLLKWAAIVFHRKILKIYDKVDFFICPTELMKEKMILGGFPERKLITIPTFTALREKRGNQAVKTASQILYFGRFTYEKGIDLLLKAWLESKLFDKGINLTIIGGSWDDIDRKNFTSDEFQKVKSQVNCIQFSSSETIESHLKSCRFTVIPSRWYDNLPNTLLEAYSYSKPVIVPAFGSFLETVIDNKTGLLYSPNDPSSLAEKMRLLATDDKLLESMVHNIPAFFEQFSPENHLARLENLIKETVSRKEI